MLPEDPTIPEYWTHTSGCPRLFLAPMEGLGDGFFRRAYRHVGGFDEACAEFLRVPKNAHCASLSTQYVADETAPTPLAAQIMGEDPLLIAEMTRRLEKRGAPRIDLNCGCPSNTVVGRGAGSSLLRTPERLHLIAKSMVDAATVPITVKLRSGYEDTSLFKENLIAAEEAGIAFITLHPRTKTEGYRLPCHWDLLSEAKQILKIPLVGSGEVRCVEDALRMQRETGCDGIMIGRGAISDPWIFHRIKAHYTGEEFQACWDKTEYYIRVFAQDLAEKTKIRTQINKLKQLLSFMLVKTEHALTVRSELLRAQATCPSEYLELCVQKCHTCFEI